jgi:hypothetical protein
MAETPITQEAKLSTAETALIQIATGGIVGELNNARDTLSIVRDIATEALQILDPKYITFFAERSARRTK